MDECDCVGMTDAQYKGLLLDQLEDWQNVLEMASKSDDRKFRKKSKNNSKINQKLKF